MTRKKESCLCSHHIKQVWCAISTVDVGEASVKTIPGVIFSSNTQTCENKRRNTWCLASSSCVLFIKIQYFPQGKVYGGTYRMRPQKPRLPLRGWGERKGCKSCPCPLGLYVRPHCHVPWAPLSSSRSDFPHKVRIRLYLSGVVRHPHSVPVGVRVTLAAGK